MPELLGARGGPPVEPHGRLAGRQPLDLDVAPADAPDAQPEDLADTASFAAQRPANVSGRIRT